MAAFLRNFDQTADFFFGVYRGVFAFGVYAVMWVGFVVAGLAARRLSLAGAALRGAETLPALALFPLMPTSPAGRFQFATPLPQAKLFRPG